MPVPLIIPEWGVETKNNSTWPNSRCLVNRPEGCMIPGPIRFREANLQNSKGAVLSNIMGEFYTALIQEPWDRKGNVCSSYLRVVKLKTTSTGALGENIIYFPYDSPNPPPTRKVEELVKICIADGSQLIIGCKRALSDVEERRHQRKRKS